MAITDSAQPAPKRGRGKKEAAPSLPEDVSVIIDEGPAEPIVDPATGAVQITNEDGSVTINLDGDDGPDLGSPEGFYDNLSPHIDQREKDRIATELIDGIETDKGDRKQWEQMRAKAIELLGFKLDDPKSDVSASSAGMSMSVVRDPIVAEAVLRFQANAFGELCPSSGPVKVMDFGADDVQSDGLAQSLEDDLNFYLTTTASEYYPDTRDMLFKTGLYSGMFKKVFTHPIKNRPVSESVDGVNLIVNSNATDLKSAGRVTHEISMRKSVMRRMQLLGVYEDVDLTDPLPLQPNAVAQKAANVEGRQIQSSRIEDQDYTVYECYCELDIKGFEDEDEDGEPTGLPLPYRVTIEESSKKILEIRRNWDEDDESKTAKIPFVLFPYATGLGIYGMGLGQILGNIAAALTALMREAIDAGMFANFPGFLYAKDAASGRQMTNEFRIPPGGGAGIQTGGMPIGQTVMPLPYKDVSPAMIQLIDQTRGVGQKLGGTADTPVGEGTQDAPVGTTLALIEQATKIEGAVHKALHAAQAEEFRLLVDLFKEDPEALWRGNRRPKMGGNPAERMAKFKEALERCDIVPMADPNTPSHMHRLMKATAIKQLTAGNPMYDQKKVDTFVGEMMKIDVPSFFAPPPPPNTQPDPRLMVEMGKLRVAEQKNQIDAAKVQVQAENADKDRKSKETIETLKIAQTLAVHPEANQIVDEQLVQMAPFLHPVTGEASMPPSSESLH